MMLRRSEAPFGLSSKAIGSDNSVAKSKNPVEPDFGEFSRRGLKTRVYKPSSKLPSHPYERLAPLACSTVAARGQKEQSL